MSGTVGTIIVGAGDITVVDLSLLATYDVSDGGVLIIPSDLAGVSVGTTINLLGGGTLEVGSSLVSLNLLNSLTLSGTNNELSFSSATLLNGLDLSGTGFGSTDSIALNGTDSITGVTYDSTTGQLALATTSGVEVLKVPAGLDAADFGLTQTTSESVVTYTACYARGTLIATPRGGLPVEKLEPGMQICLARGGAATIRWTGHRRLRPSLAEQPEAIAPVRIDPGALGDNLPHRSLVLSPDHAVYVDGVLIPIKLLVNGRTIRAEIVDVIDYFHIELDRHELIVAEGSAAETYIDTGNRGMFANAPLVDAQPMLTGSVGADPASLCAPLVLAGEKLRAVRARLALVIVDFEPRSERAVA